MTTQHNVPTNERATGNHSLYPLTEADADHLIHLAGAALRARNLATAYDPVSGTFVITPSSGANQLEGARFGLSNLARKVAPHPQSCWPQLVAQHFDVLTAGILHPPDLPTDPERQLYLRLVARSSLPPEFVADLPDFLPGLVAVPASDQNGTYVLHFDPSPFGMTWTEAHRIALANLNRFTDNVTFFDRGDVRVAVLSNTSWAASRALVLDTVLRESLQIENPQYGVLVALPARHLLLIHVIRDLSLLPALSAMLHLSHHSYESDPGPLTPTIYLADPTGWHPATTTPPNHPLRHHPSPHLRALTQTLAPLEQPPRAAPAPNPHRQSPAL